MFVATIPNRNSPPAILVRESYREDGKVKSRTLLNITHWPLQRIEAMRRLCRGEFDHLAFDSIPAIGPILGVLFTLYHIAKSIGVVAALGPSRRARLALFLVLHRIASGGSRLAAVRWAKNHAVAEVLGLDPFTEDALYDALDFLDEYQQKVELRLYKRYLEDHSEPPSLVLYDVTSVWLEGDQNELGAYGYDRNGRRGKKIVIVGLLTDGSGEPLAIRCFDGNRGDTTTVAEQVEILKRQFGIDRVVFVGDGGMLKGEAVAAVDGAQFDYITSLGRPEIRARLKRGVIQLGLFDEKLAEVVDDDGRRLVLRRNPATMRKEQHRRTDKLDRLAEMVKERNAFVKDSKRAVPEAGLRNVSTWIKTHKLDSFVDLKLDERALSVSVDEEAMAEAARLDGCYVIVSNVRADHMSKEQIHEAYMGLQQVERDFRSLKSTELWLRPIYVRKASRTRGHVFCAMLALKVVREIRRRLTQLRGGSIDADGTSSLEDALAILSRITLLKYPIGDGNSMFRMPVMGDRERELLEALQVPTPTAPKPPRLPRPKRRPRQ